MKCYAAIPPTGILMCEYVGQTETDALLAAERRTQMSWFHLKDHGWTIEPVTLERGHE